MRCYLRAASFAVLAFALSLAASGHASAQRVNYASQTPSSVTVFYFSLPAGTQLIFLNEISSAETIAAIPPVSGTGSVTIPYSVLPPGPGQYYVLARQSGFWVAQTVMFYLFI
jgi:hypothetical protein